MTGHRVYAAHDSILVGADPLYTYGIIMEVSDVDPTAIVVNSCLKNLPVRLMILNDSEEEIEVLSPGGSCCE